MNSEKIILQKSPPLEFIFNESSFQIVNAADPNIEGVYKYDKVKSIRFKREKTNWVATILSFLSEFFLSIGNTDIYKDKKRLTINYEKKRIKLNLLDCEQVTIDKLIFKLNSNLNSETST